MRARWISAFACIHFVMRGMRGMRGMHGMHGMHSANEVTRGMHFGEWRKSYLLRGLSGRPGRATHITSSSCTVMHCHALPGDRPGMPHKRPGTHALGQAGHALDTA
jgi:hypothetical protein